jgi:RNA binding exosome subunit
MKYVHNVRLRIIDRDKDALAAAFSAFLSEVDIEPKLSTITYSNDGDADEPLHLGELWIDRQQPVRKVLKYLRTLTQAEQELIRTQPERFLDTATHCFLRLDRAVFPKPALTTNAAHSVHVRLNIAAFPATKENAIPVMQTLFASNTTV